MVVFAVHPVEPQGTTTVSAHATAVIVIPARYDSSRLPGKPLAQISGRPMIAHVYRRAASASGAATVLVAAAALLRSVSSAGLSEERRR